MNPTCSISEGILKGANENEGIHGKHVYLISVLIQSCQDNTDLVVTSAEECVAIISKALEHITFPKIAEIAHEQRADAKL